MLKTTKSSIASAYGVDDNDVLNGSGGGSISRSNRLKNWQILKNFKSNNLKSGNLEI